MSCGNNINLTAIQFKFLISDSLFVPCHLENRMLVGHILVGRARLTPGSFRLPGKTGKSKERPANTPDKVKRGRPIKKRLCTGTSFTGKAIQSRK
jgi:hypothetical protein